MSMNVHDDAANNIFTLFDRYGHGSVGVDHLKDVMQDLNYTEAATMLVLHCDTNKDGMVTKEEFIKGFKKYTDLRRILDKPLASPRPRTSPGERRLKEIPTPPQFKNGVATVMEDTPIKVAIQAMLDNHVRAIPVIKQQDSKVCGMLDCMDVVAFLARKVFVLGTGEDGEAEEAGTLLSQRGTYGEEEEGDAELLWNATAGQLTNFSGQSPLVTVPDTANMVQAAEVLLAYRVRRVPVVNSAGTIVNAISQKMCVQLFASQLAVLSRNAQHAEAVEDHLRTRTLEKTQQSVKDARVGEGQLVKVTQRQSLALVIKKMVEEGANSVAVVDARTGEMLNFLSSKDIVELLVTPEFKFNMFLLEMQKTSYFKLSEKKWRKNIVTAKPTSSIMEVAKAFVDTDFKIHNIYLTDERNRPIQQITLFDILPFALQERLMTH